MLALWQFFATVPVFGKMLLPPFFFSNPVDVGEPDRQMVLDRRDLEASRDHAVGIDPRVRDRLARLA